MNLPGTTPPPLRLMDQVSVVCRRRHLSRRAEQAYRFWNRRYSHFHSRQHPRVVGPPGTAAFINHLASVGAVSASTQSQALNALLFFYRDVPEVDIGHLSGLKRIQRRNRLPVVRSMDEVAAILGQMEGTTARSWAKSHLVGWGKLLALLQACSA